MCTVSWLYTHERYHLLCNRDERHTRKPALAPRVQIRQGVRFIAPVDADFGGTWIAVNESGLSLCLLNQYPKRNNCSRESTGVRSRGLLPMYLADCRSLAELPSRIFPLELNQVQPFKLLALAPREPCLLFHWTGHDTILEENGQCAMPLVSSSFDQEGVELSRKQLFETMAARQGQTEIERLLAFQSSHLPVPSAYSPCMHRADASTVSFSWITVAGEGVEFRYLPCAPCSQPASGPVALSLAKPLTVRRVDYTTW